jgi:serine protease Do
MTLSRQRHRAAFAAALLAGSALGGLAFTRGAPAQAPAPTAIAAPALASAALPGFADLVARVRPAVVTITMTGREAASEGASPFPPGSPQDERFRRHFGGEAGRSPVRGLGSGFVVDAAGHIVTNNHVVQGATAVKVTLEDGRELSARIIGTDPRTDLALLKVEAGAPLPFLALGDSDSARPGDWVVAVGNPFGLGGSVSAGIVSARGRSIGAGPYDDFIQIDAPINSGNSGGPLFDANGRVVGVNTAIFSPSGGNVGIGFAVPSNMVRSVMAQLQEHGRVERGFLGATTQAMTPALAQALKLPEGKGALIADVAPGSPAARAGLRAGDVVTSVDGRAIAQQRDLARGIGEAKPGSVVALSVWRDGERQELRATLASLNEREGFAATQNAEARRGGPAGLALAPLDPSARQALKLPAEARGAVVAAVRPESPAATAGLQPGDVITSIGSQAVTGPEEAARAIGEGMRGNTPLALRILREGEPRFVALPPASRA